MCNFGGGCKSDPFKEERLFLTKKMVAVLRLMMNDINIAATTASETIAPDAKVSLLNAGANVVMPNLTPERYGRRYSLYEGKPVADLYPEQLPGQNRDKLDGTGLQVFPWDWGDSGHYCKRMHPPLAVRAR